MTSRLVEMPTPPRIEAVHNRARKVWEIHHTDTLGSPPEVLAKSFASRTMALRYVEHLRLGWWTGWHAEMVDWFERMEAELAS